MGFELWYLLKKYMFFNDAHVLPFNDTSISIRDSRNNNNKKAMLVLFASWILMDKFGNQARWWKRNYYYHHQKLPTHKGNTNVLSNLLLSNVNSLGSFVNFTELQEIILDLPFCFQKSKVM